MRDPTPPQPGASPEPEAAKRGWAKRGLIIFLVVANLGIFGGLGALWFAARKVSEAVPTTEVEGLTPSPRDSSDPRTFLIIGSDSREDLPEDFTGYGSYGGQRADVIMLVQVIPDGNDVQLLSIPRDLRVVVDGSPAKINGVFNSGGSAMIAAVSEFAQVPIHHYLEIDFARFAGLVDSEAIGGIEMTFPYKARDTKSKFAVEAGTHTLDGKQALALARSRNYQEFRNGEWQFVEASDIGRTRRQQDLLMAMLTQIERPSSIGGFTDLARALGDFVTTDQDFDEDVIIQLAWEMRSLNAGDLDAVTLPVQGFEEGGISYVIPRDPDAGQVLAALLAGEPLSESVTGNASVEVQNGNGVTGSAGTVADLLTAAGFNVVGTGNSGREDHAITLVIARPNYLTQAEAVVAELGFGQVEIGPVPKTAHVVVIVGADALGG